MQIILASNNKNKIQEINDLLEGKFEVISLLEAGITEEIPEPFDTFELNAHAKAQYAFNRTGIMTFAEDSGLVIPSLNGAPGVYSARYAGEPRSDERNTALLLQNLQGIEDRKAHYKTVICLVHRNGIAYFDGTCEGNISATIEGTGGFGYDPVFVPEGYEQTFGVLAPSVKKAISHRAKAMAQFINFMQKENLG